MVDQDTIIAVVGIALGWFALRTFSGDNPIESTDPVTPDIPSGNDILNKITGGGLTNDPNSSIIDHTVLGDQFAGLTGDPDTSVIDGGLTGDPDTSVVRGGLTGDPNTNIIDQVTGGSFRRTGANDTPEGVGGRPGNNRIL